MKIAALDMGREMYGDCLYLDLDGYKVLIDGGHPGDYGGGADIPAQLERLTGKAAPFEIDLLVVTHSHNDHVGCLPELVEDEVIRVRAALVSDPDHRYGAEEELDSLTSGLPNAARDALNLLGEELPDPTDPLFAEALDKIVPGEPRYRDMIRQLREQGAVVVRYGTDSMSPLSAALKTHGIRVLGPTKSHLQICAKRLKEERDKAARRVRDAFSKDFRLTRKALARVVFGVGGLDALDAGKNKGAVNDLSIVLLVEGDGKRALLPGDMQFADAQVDGLQAAMATLLKKTAAAGPYDIIKLSHHTSHNGWSEQMHVESLRAPVLIHSGGLNDESHPHPETLEMMEEHSEGRTLLRTDRNGLIVVDTAGGDIQLSYDGEPNDFTKNRRPDLGATSPEPMSHPVVQVKSLGTTAATSRDAVRVIAEVPPGNRVTITVEVAPLQTHRADEPPRSSRPPEPVVAKAVSQPFTTVPASEKPDFSGLLFFTNEDALQRKIGSDSVRQARELISGAGGAWDGSLPEDFSVSAIQTALAKANSKTKGVVLLGDYDSIPPARCDCLPPEVRDSLSPTSNDPDNFVVWSDGFYGDINHDGVQELPVSRVPDCGSPKFFLDCLRRTYRPLSSQLTIRNVARPFADEIHQQIPRASGQPLQSKPSSSADLDSQRLRDAYVYLMLHGSDFDASRFWGEDEDHYIEAVTADGLPEMAGSLVFAGCCWGALIGREAAYRVIGERPPPTRTSTRSMALQSLSKGATAFIGCTGAHYSPTRKPYGYYGGPLHTHFWAAVQGGQPPAEALLTARQRYLAAAPHRGGNPRPAVDDLAVELKIYHQFTCLGLGW